GGTIVVGSFATAVGVTTVGVFDGPPPPVDGPPQATSTLRTRRAIREMQRTRRLSDIPVLAVQVGIIRFMTVLLLSSHHIGTQTIKHLFQPGAGLRQILVFLRLF